MSETETAEAPAETAKIAYAMVEIFGHRQHYAEIRDVEIAGGKLLEVRDVDTQKVHMYGAAAIFSLTPMSDDDMQEHLTATKRRREQDEQWRRMREERRQAMLAAPEAEINAPLPF